MAQPPKQKDPPHSPEDKQALGASLAAARQAAGFSLGGAAAALTLQGHPISKAGIGHWETGTNVVDALWLRRLAQLYGATMDMLTGASDAPAWPFSTELQAQVAALDETGLHFMEVAMWAKLNQEVPASVAESPKHRLRQRGAGVNTVTPSEKATKRS